MTHRHLLLPALLLLALPPAARAQPPSAEWRTLATPHFRVHYPAPSEAWARFAAARLESIRERVVEEVGYAPPEVVDVLVSDPVADPNGMALPFLGWPRMILWTSPPGPESVIGNYRNWPELLIVHEETHLVHLLRPSRNPLRRLLQRSLPLGPISLRAPRWVSEGYATVVEGRLTASGRPHGDLRASILRQWAREGKLPSYGRLAADPVSWRGMSMAYLVGSAYLEWLEERAGAGSLKKLWARMTARHVRSFDDAFEGVFGDSPADLYDRFQAELTWRALEAERLLETARTPEEEARDVLWQDLAWTTGAPAVSPDGSKLAIVLRAREKPARLVVWPTGPDEETEKEWREDLEEVLERDPEDVAPVRVKPFSREPLHELTGGDGTDPTTPRWMPDGRSLLFVRFEPDPQGFLHPDLFLWTPEGGEVRRLTRFADLRDPDPAPDGRWAAAVRNRHGFSQIVRVDLATAEVRELTDPSVEIAVDRPRVSPDGGRVAFARHREGEWRLVILDLATGAEAELPPPASSLGGGTLSSPAWSRDGGTLFAVAGQQGFVDLWACPLDPAASGWIPLVRSHGAALAPEPSPDGGLFYLALAADGLDLRRLELAEDLAAMAAPPRPALPPALAPAVRPPAPEPPAPFEIAELAPPRPYGLGRLEWASVGGGTASTSGDLFEAGARVGDVVGRFDALALASFSDSGRPEGGALAAAWRGWPVEVGVHLFQAEERLSEQPDGVPAGLGLDTERRGLELSAAWSRMWSGGRLELELRGLAEDVEPLGSSSRRREAFSFAGSWGGFRRWGDWEIEPGAAVHLGSGSTEGVEGWERWGGLLGLGIGREDTRLRVSWRRDDSDGLAEPFDRYRVGGSPASVLPESDRLHRIAVPALPEGVLLGREHEGQRAELALPFLPAPLFWERHRVRGPSSPDDLGQDDWTGWLSIAGLEWTWRLGPFPVGKLPELHLRAGVAQVLEEPFEPEIFDGDTRWWLAAVWRP